MLDVMTIAQHVSKITLSPQPKVMIRGWHSGDINVTMTLNLNYTTYIVIVSGPYNTSILAVV